MVSGVVRRTFAHLAVAVLIALCGSTLSGTGHAEEPASQEPSVATRHLFGRAHLEGITKPATLRYAFTRSSSLGDGFSDTVDLNIDAIRAEGRRDTSFEFFTGNRRRPYPDLTDFFGNPLVVVFLQRDVWELSRVRGGQARYFRYRIREALREKATVEPETIETQTGTLDGHRITIKPYENDRYRQRLDQFEFKTYEFVVSDDIPGEIYMIKTRVPATVADKEGEAPLIEETIVFKQQLEHSTGEPAAE